MCLYICRLVSSHSEVFLAFHRALGDDETAALKEAETSQDGKPGTANSSGIHTAPQPRPITQFISVVIRVMVRNDQHNVKICKNLISQEQMTCNQA